MAVPRFPDRSTVLEHAEAEQLLPVVRTLAARIQRRVALRSRFERDIEILELLDATTTHSGPELDELVDKKVRYYRLGGQIDALADRLASLGCTVRKREARWVDFTCLRDDGLAVFCWRSDEEHVGHWHFMHEDHDNRRALERPVAPAD